MTHPEPRPENESLDDLQRVADEVRERLRARGVAAEATDSPEDLAVLLESVEDFEIAVESRGGDLFVDEPPLGSEGQPDDPRFAIPARVPRESARTYASRLTEAASRIRTVAD
jgi:hypothetical protein